MWPLIQGVWQDPAKFTALVRGLVATAGVLVASGAIPTGGSKVAWWIGVLAPALSQMLAAGQKNGNGGVSPKQG